VIELDQFIDLFPLQVNQSHINSEYNHQDDEYGITQVGDVEVERIPEKQDCQYIENQHVPFISILL
jgi:hypothetical protein